MHAYPVNLKVLIETEFLTSDDKLFQSFAPL